ncbi:MAG TPA: T9SS type A sorting domain-containing protein [Saprospiraceae bacterium]|nr:T9SS type A sorting domain-containing protein [Saprospiraceae bacterium]
MVRNLLLFLFFLTFISLQGQIRFSPERITILGTPDEEIITFTLDIENTGTNDIQLFWRLTKPSDFPSGWVTQFCDFNLCYNDNVDEINIELPNTIKGGEKKDFKIYLLPKGHTGASSLMLHIYSDRYFSNELLEMGSEMVMVTTTTSSRNHSKSPINIYPNPSHEFFQVAHDDDVRKIAIYNIVGKEIGTFDHYKGKRHNVTYLEKGIYIIRFFDQKGEVMKSIRLQKS